MASGTPSPAIPADAADDPAVAELVVTHDGAAADLCKGEAACWTGYELSGTCDAQPWTWQP